MTPNKPSEPGNISAEEIFNGHYNLASGKQADETTRKHMQWVLNAMQEYAAPHIQRCQELETLNHLRSKDTSIERINDVIRIQKEVIEKYKAQLQSEQERGRKLVGAVKIHMDAYEESSDSDLGKALNAYSSTPQSNEI